MDYRITCICGHSFLVPQEKLGTPVTCPSCGQKLSPVADSSAPATTSTLAAGASPDSSSSATTATPVSAPAEQTKRCPYCGEVILAVARKCKHCGEFLDRAPPAAGPLAPPAGAADAPVPAADVPAVYSLTTSQWDNFWRFIILFTLFVIACAVFILVTPLHPIAPVGIPAALVFAGFIAWYFYLAARYTKYFVRPTRIDAERGILSKDVNSLDLFRIVHVEFKQGLIQRLLGIGTIQLMTRDQTEPELELFQIPHAREVLKYIQAQIPVAARQRGAIYMEK